VAVTDQLEDANLRVSAWAWRRRFLKLRYQYVEACRRFHAKRQAALEYIDGAIAVGGISEVWVGDLQALRDILDPKPSELMPPPGMGTRG
jgi:hypothetical protein